MHHVSWLVIGVWLTFGLTRIHCLLKPQSGDDDGDDNIKEMLRVLLKKLDKAADDDVTGVDERRAYNVSHIQLENENKNTHNAIVRNNYSSPEISVDVYHLGQPLPSPFEDREYERWKLPQEATEIDTKELSRLLRRLLDEVDKGNKQQSSADDDELQLAELGDAQDDSDKTEDIVPQPRFNSSDCGKPAIKPHVSLARIVGGVEARRHSWPWQCSVRLVIGAGVYHVCGASVISPHVVVSAAHCVFDENQRLIPASMFIVACGGHDQTVNDPARQTLYVSRVTVHPDYNPTGQDSDVALFHLDRRLTLNSYVHPICLPRWSVPPNIKCVVTGWGQTQNTGDDTVLRQVVVPIITRAECNRYLNDRVNNHMLCAGYEAGGKDSCQGDSGGPLVCYTNDHWWLQGIVSWGVGCADPRKPGVYVDVKEYVQWIHSKTGVAPPNA